MTTNSGLAYPDPGLANGDVFLSPWTEGDAPALAAAWADEHVQSGCAVPPLDRRGVADAQRWISGHQERVAANLTIDLVVRSADGVVTGEVGLGPFDWSKPAAMLGFWTAPGWGQQGRASQSAQLLCDWAFQELGLVAVLAETTTTNVGSQKVLEATGFKLAKTSETGKQLWHRHPNPAPEIFALEPL